MGAVLLLAAVLGVTACSSNVKSEAVVKAKAAGTFDLTLQSYKSGQFLLGGAVLSPLDLKSHFAYLREQGELPKKVLLERSEDTKIHKQHLRYMAGLAESYGFTVYYDDDGELRQIIPAAKDAKTRLPDSPKPDHKNDADKNGYSPAQG